MPDPLPEHLSALRVYQFTEELMSKAPTPGGGGTAALIGSLAASLAAMATNLTIGKKKFLPFEQDHLSIIAETNMLRLRLLELMDEDAAAFAPLSRVYALDKDSPGYADQLETATLNACKAPCEMMDCCCKLISILEDLRGKCSVLLLSDVGCAALAACCALESASMNVFVNTRMLPGCTEAEAMSTKAQAMLEEYLPRARAVADSVMNYLRTTK